MKRQGERRRVEGGGAENSWREEEKGRGMVREEGGAQEDFSHTIQFTTYLQSYFWLDSLPKPDGSLLNSPLQSGHLWMFDFQIGPSKLKFST